MVAEASMFIVQEERFLGMNALHLDSFFISNLGQYYFDSKLMTNPNRHSRAAFLCERTVLGGRASLG